MFALANIGAATTLAGGAVTTLGGVVGIDPSRTRSRSANKALREQALTLAVTDARAGSREAYEVIRQWAGLVPNGSVPAAWPARYPGPQGNGAWPAADGSKAAAEAAARDLESRFQSPSLSTEGAAGSGGFGRLIVLAGIAAVAGWYFMRRKGA